MKLLTSALTVLLLLIQPGEAQEGQEKTGSIAGKVVDQRTGQALYPANVVCLPGNHGTTTDARGTFSLTGLPAGSFDLEITYLGYEKSTVSGVALETGQKLDLGELTLFESALSLSEITVSPGTFSVMGNTPLSRQTLSERDLKSMSFAEDITRAVSRLPGVASNDFSSKFTVRGGETDEVLINLDGMELYDPFHQRDFVGGLFSIVDIETIEGVDLLTGGFSAEYGNRQSGVFNLRTRSAGEQGRHTTLGLSVMNAGLYSDGPIMGGKGNYLLSARRGMLDQVFKLIGQDENTPTFYDLLGKVEFPLNAKHRLSLHLLHAGDKTAVRDVTEEAFDIHDTRYGNTYGWLTLNSFFSAKWYSRSYLYGGFLSQKRNGNTQKYEYSDKLVFQLSDQRDFGFAGFKQDWDWSPSEKYFIRFGGDYRRLNSDYQYSLNLQDVRVNAADSLVDFRQQTELSLKPSGHHASGYLSLRMNLLPGVFAEPGIRYEDVSYTGDRLWSPRLGVALALSQHTVLRGAWGYYYQSQDIHKLDVNHATDQFDPAELSKHYVAGLEHQFSNGIRFRMEAYYKDISRLSPTYQNLRDPWEVFPESRNDVVRLDISDAYARGIEWFLKYDTGSKISWWFSYALADAKENVSAIAFDGLLDRQTGSLPRYNNQRHTIYCDLNYRPFRNWHFNLSWQFYNGIPQTLYEYRFQTLPNDSLHFYPDHLSFRGNEYPAYHRMDLRINRYFHFGGNQVAAFLHLINLYNRENLRKFDLDVRNDAEQLVPDGQGGYQYFRDDKTWFGFTPVLGLRWSF